MTGEGYYVPLAIQRTETLWNPHDLAATLETLCHIFELETYELRSDMADFLARPGRIPIARNYANSLRMLIVDVWIGLSTCTGTMASLEPRLDRWMGWGEHADLVRDPARTFP